MICKHCGAEILDGDEFCYSCGQPVHDSNTVKDPRNRVMVCGRCGRYVGSGGAFCPYCGGVLYSAAEYKKIKADAEKAANEGAALDDAAAGTAEATGAAAAAGSKLSDTGEYNLPEGDSQVSGDTQVFESYESSIADTKVIGEYDGNPGDTKVFGDFDSSSGNTEDLGDTQTLGYTHGYDDDDWFTEDDAAANEDTAVKEDLREVFDVTDIDPENDNYRYEEEESRGVGRLPLIILAVIICVLALILLLLMLRSCGRNSGSEGSGAGAHSGASAAGVVSTDTSSDMMSAASGAEQAASGKENAVSSKAEASESGKADAESSESGKETEKDSDKDTDASGASGAEGAESEGAGSEDSEAQEEAGRDSSEAETESEEEVGPVEAIVVGDTKVFGGYEQDTFTSNGPEPISWKVLAVEKGKALVVTEKCIDVQQYHNTNGPVTWESSTIRSWLNNEFYNTAFTAEEQSRILETDVVNSDNVELGVDGGADTKDKIFLLSLDEVHAYFADDTSRIAQPTDYAISRGSEVPGAHQDQVPAGVTSGCWWWLRTPGNAQNTAIYVDVNGTVPITGWYTNVTDQSIRPAMWIDIRE